MFSKKKIFLLTAANYMHMTHALFPQNLFEIKINGKIKTRLVVPSEETKNVSRSDHTFLGNDPESYLDKSSNFFFINFCYGLRSNFHS